MKKHQNFTEGNMFKPLLLFALPVLLSLFLQAMYGAVDMLVVGKFATAADVSAVSTGSWIMTLITSFVVGIAMGTTVLLGQRLGEGRPQAAGKIIGASVWLFVIIGIIMTILVEIFAPQIANIMHIPTEAFDATVAYIRICGGGAIFIIAYNVLGSIFRGIGNSQMPLITVAIACATNIVCDFLLVGYCGMGVAGAAIATVFAQFFSVLLSLLIIRKMELPFQVTKEELLWNPKQMWEVFRLGFPIALQDVLVNISFLVITAIVNTLGVIPSAGVGVAEKLCSFIMLAPSAFSQTMAAVVSQNIGAGKKDRAIRALIYGILSSLSVGVIMAYLSFFHGDIMAGLFSNDAEVISAGAEYLKAYAIDTILVSIMFCMVGYFNGSGKTTFVMIQGIVGAFLVRIPVSFMMSQIKPINLFRIGLATPASTIVQIILCVIYFCKVNGYIKKKEPLTTKGPMCKR